MQMVSVYGRARSGMWYAAFPDPKSGHRVCRVTDFRRDDPQGKRRALAWARDQAKDGMLTRGDGPQSGWAAWVDPWIRLKYRSRPSSLTSALQWWGWLHSFLVERKINTPRALDRATGMSYIAWRTAQVKRSGKSPKFNSALQELKMLSRIMREAIQLGYADRNPVERLGLERDTPTEKPEIIDSEIKLIRAKLETIECGLPIAERWMTISFEVALHTGVRFKETQIKMERIDFGRNSIQLWDGKTKEYYGIPIHPNLRALLIQLRDAGATVTCKVPARASVKWTFFFKGRAERNREGFLSHLCFHCTRVTVITRMAREGVPVQMAMAYVHHASELIHRIYQRLAPNDLVRCLGALNYPPRGDDSAQTPCAPPAS